MSATVPLALVGGFFINLENQSDKPLFWNLARRMRGEIFVTVQQLQSSSKMLGRLPIFTFFVLVPPAPGSMLDKTKMVFVRNCCYMSQH